MPFARRLAAVIACLAVLATAGVATASGIGPEGEAVPVTARPIDHFRIGRPEVTQFGRLTFLGGLELLSPNRHMGGLSGLLVTDEGRDLIAVADNGLWLSARVKQDDTGRPLALESARVAPLLGPGGETLMELGRGDSEALTLRRTDAGAELLVSTERRHGIFAFPYPLDFAAHGREIPLPAAIKSLRHNKGMEAVAAANSGPLAGTLVVIAERGPTFADDMPGFLIGGPRPGTFTLKRQDDYDATDAGFLPDGDLLLLERRFTLRHGIGMRLRLLPAAELVPGAQVVGSILLEAGFNEQIDNMEGLSVHRSPSGDTVVTLVSDDNRSILQRTLLLRFRLDGD